jgi:hemoglobin
MKKDIETRADVEEVLTVFYQKVFKDDLIGFFFTEVVPLNLDTHIPVIADFWESVLFGARGYRKNVMQVHQHISDLATIKKEHLNRWVQLFTQTINDLAEGDTAELMKQRAQSIATLMEIKIHKDFRF